VKTNIGPLTSVPLNNGVLMPIIGLGTWKSKGEQAYEAAYHAIKNGYRMIDTATCYGNEKYIA